MNQEYEYIATLSPEEKKIFVESFCCMVCSDKKVAKYEDHRYYQIRRCK